MSPGDYAAVANARVKEVRFRLGSAVFIAAATCAFTDTAAPALIWFAALVCAQVIDHFLSLPIRRHPDPEPAIALKAAYGLSIAFSAALFSSIAVFNWFAGDVSGNQLQRQPEWLLSGSLNYSHELAGDWDWYVGGDASYQSGVYVGNDNQGYLPEHTYVNTKLGVRSGVYTVEFWTRNLFDDRGAIAAFRDIYWANTDNLYEPRVDQGDRPDFDDFVPLRYTVTYPRGRTFGVTALMRFGAAVR